MLFDVSDDKLFVFRTVHKTTVFVDENCRVVHKNSAEQNDLPLFARLLDQKLSCFVLKNNAAKYICSIDEKGRASFSDECRFQTFTRNVLDNSLLVKQNDRYWSAHKTTGFFWLAPRGSAWESFFLEPIKTVECGKTDVVIVSRNSNALDVALQRLNSNQINIKAVLLEGLNEEELETLSTEKNLPCVSITKLDKILLENRDAFWFPIGYSDVEFLKRHGVPLGNIIDISLKMQATPTWFANVKAAVENEFDFIAVGGLQTAFGIDVGRIFGRKGINLAAAGQDLRQSFLTAKHVLERNSAIKFVLLGLSLETLTGKTGADCRYFFADVGSSIEKKLFGAMFNSKTDLSSTAEPDPNLLALKTSAAQNYSIESFDECGELKDTQLQLLEDFVAMCLKHDATPVVLHMPSIDGAYPIEKINFLRRILQYMEKARAFKFIDLSTTRLNFEHFSTPRLLNVKGSEAVGNVLNFRLHEKNVLPFEDMRFMLYERLFELRTFLSAEEYNNMMSEIFAATVEAIKQKPKIKIGFALFDASMWCGDLLYQLFAENERYEATVFFCLRPDEKTALTDENFRRGLNLLRSNGLHVEEMSNNNKKIPKQDVLIYLTPYFGYLTRAFRPDRITAETLITYIPYGFRTTYWNISSFKINFIAWKLFMDSRAMVQFISRNHGIAAERLVYSGLPKTDKLFTDAAGEVCFDWKCARSDAVKIIWAPHWSIKGFRYHRLATFQFNYKFLYEYAAAHPETSWIVKPHPQLLTSAVTTGVFPSTEAFEEYLRKWDALPNARVVTGGYYQDIFETSDGMILDSGSFIAEYQFTQKPMLFLTRKGECFSELGKAIIKANYSVDGSNFDGIAKFIDEVLINRHDVMSEARRKVFDAQLNYVKDNGMLAGEKIFRTIDQPLRR